MNSWPYRILHVAIIALASLKSVYAVNVAFMPGDAFFHSDLTLKSLSGEVSEDVRFNYARPPRSGGFGGYAGFERLTLTGDTSLIMSQLKRVYESLRDDTPLELRINQDGSQTEINGFHLFIYNKEVQWRVGRSSQRIGIKYNESWSELPKSAFQSETRELGFGHTKAHAYATFVPVSKAIIHDWQYGARFGPLDVQVPRGTGWGISGPRIKATVTIDASHVQFLVIPYSNLKPYFLQRKGREFYTISVEGVRRNEFGGDTVRVEDWAP